MNNLYLQVLKFKTRYPLTIGWRLSAHSSVIESHINPDEKILYSFVAQKNESNLNLLNTCVVALTDKRLLIGHKRLLFGYFFYSITPDMFNDLTVRMGLLWGKVYIDTIRELVILSNISKRALIEIESKVSAYMLEQKKLYPHRSRAKE